MLRRVVSYVAKTSRVNSVSGRGTVFFSFRVYYHLKRRRFVTVLVFGSRHILVVCCSRMLSILPVVKFTCQLFVSASKPSTVTLRPSRSNKYDVTGAPVFFGQSLCLYLPAAGLLKVWKGFKRDTAMQTKSLPLARLAMMIDDEHCRCQMSLV
ncbi:uncharacterized protein EDB91DRAFT_1167826 [Suillus paluster]|uniref:uncharacterized protein n=1 Tax=Suillus paluster TaxID=48578 RepID=UPI001B86F12C|nr:uncharacterized protein EDB91DRAFT_1167826 [Suillus paluster]KAG1725627.1 hypothetical protein EDB91DRAFT_1167826 [Suillus paluster]